MRTIISGCRKIVGWAIIAFILLLVMSVFGGKKSGSDGLPTLAILPTLTWTAQPTAVAVIETEPPGVTIIPTVERSSSGFVTITPAPGTVYLAPTIEPSPTITDTPASTDAPTPQPGSDEARAAAGGTLAVPLSIAFMQIDGVESVNISVIPGINGDNIIVGGDAQVKQGTNTRNTAEMMRTISYQVLATAFLDFGVILDDGTQAVSYTWDNTTDTWQTTNLASASAAAGESDISKIIPVDNGAGDLNIMVIVPITYYAEKQVNVRSCPQTSCERLGQVAPLTALVVDAMVDGGEVDSGNWIWYRVQYGGRQAYVYSGLMIAQLPRTQQPIIIQQPPAPQPVTSGYTGPIPKNCTEARAMGIDQITAARINPKLDRDGDGKACYDDQ